MISVYSLAQFFPKRLIIFKTDQKKREKKWRHVRYTILKKFHDKVLKAQLSCCDALCNIWPSCLARFAQVCPWFVLGKKTENLTTILHSWELIWLPDVSNFTVIQRTPSQTTPEASVTITDDSWGRPKWIPFPGIPELSPSQQCPWSAVRSGHQRLKPALKALTLGHEPALRGFYPKRLWNISPIYMVPDTSGNVTYYWSFQETTDFWISSQPSESRWTAEWV